MPVCKGETKTFVDEFSSTRNRVVTISTNYSSSEALNRGVNATLVATDWQDKPSVSQNA